MMRCKLSTWPLCFQSHSSAQTIVEGRFYFEKRALRPSNPGIGHIPIPGLIFDPESQQPMSKSLLEGLYYVPKEALSKGGSRSARPAPA